MKFLCGSCRTKYQIADEKVRGKILTIRCKKCGTKVMVKESLARAGGIAIAPLAEQAKKVEHEQRRVAQGAAQGASTLSSAFDVALSEAADDMPTCIGPTPANEQDAGIEWYTAIDGVQHGPFAFAEVVRRVRAQELSGRHYVWHDGMGPWQRIRECEDLKAFLPPEEPPRRKPPPPPPPAAEAVALAEGPGAEVVDLTTERERRAGRLRSATPAAGEEGAGSEAATATGVEALPRPTDREEQLDSVLNEALGIAGEDATAQASPDAAALSGGAGIASSIAESFTLGDADDIDPDRLFESVPRASEQELVSRENTRFFVKAAGVNAKKSRTRLGMVVGLSAVLAVVAFFGAWAGGVINVSLPGIGNPFASAAPRGGTDVPTGPGEVSEAERKRVAAQLTGADDKPRSVLESRPKRRPPARVAKASAPAPGGYVDDGAPRPEGERAGTRGDAPASLTIDDELPGSLNIVKRPINPVVPTANVQDIPVASTGRLDQNMIRQVVNNRKSSVSICYQRELKSNSNLNGKMEFLVTVQPTGVVSRSVVRTSKFKGTALAQCIAEKITAWRFPEFEGDAQQIVVPFVLQRNSY